MPDAHRAGTKVSRHAKPPAHPWLLGVLSDDGRESLLRASTERRYSTDEVLYVAGADARTVYLVLEGRVRLVRESNGRALFLHDEMSGGSLGEVPVFEGSTYPATAIAAEPTRCLLLPRHAVLNAARTQPEFALALLASLARRVRHLVERLDGTIAHSTTERLAALLLARSRAVNGKAFTLGATQQRAAEEIGTVRELVVRGLRTLREQGVIEACGGGRYRVLNEAALQRAAGASLSTASDALRHRPPSHPLPCR